MKKILFTMLFLFISSTCFGAAATMYVTPAGADTKTGADWAHAMGYAEWETDVEGSAEAGDIYYVAGGTYTLTSDFVTALDGAVDNPIYIIGVKSSTTNEPPVASDFATGTDRPLITDGASAYTFDVDDYWVVKNIRMTGSDTNSISIGSGSIIENCYASNDGAATRNALFLTQLNEAVSCELTSTNGVGVVASANAKIYGCYIHDSATGISGGTSDNFSIIGNFIDTCPIALSFGNASTTHTIVNNTLYNDDKTDAGSIGISSGTTNTHYIIINNIITGFETGISNGDNYSNTWYIDYNDFYDCGTDRTNVAITAPVRSSHDIDVNPAFTDAANGDFSVTAAGVLGDGLMGPDGN